MRKMGASDNGKLKVHAIAGTRVVLLALDLSKADARGLRGFAFRRRVNGGEWSWLTGLKIFEKLFPQGVKAAEDGKIPRFFTNEHPIQSFMWSDYQANPQTRYEFEVSAMFGEPGALEARHTASIDITTEAEDDGRHGIWFNRGAIASQAFAEKFGNKALGDDEYNDPENKEVAWLSRGLLEACIAHIRETPAGDGLRVAAYEFTYLRFAKELKAAIDRGVDVRIVFHDTKVNNANAELAGLAEKVGNRTILFRRTKTKIPHNKFIVRLAGGTDPVSVWTGSTNFTPSGFLGQTNVGHKVTDAGVAKTYFKFWTGLTSDPDDDHATVAAVGLTPNPANLVGPGVTLVFSPRTSTRMLDWYGARIADAKTSSMFTGAFSVDPKILAPMAAKGPSMRFILLERPPTEAIEKAQQENPADLQFSYGAILGKEKMEVEERTGRSATGKKVTKIVPIPHFKIESWFLDEELERQSGDGFVFFIHTKFLLIDPLSQDPLICTGSANFSGGSLTANDENMLLIRGDTRVADIYLTEFDRIFRHFYSRDIINKIEKLGGEAKVGILDPSGKWLIAYYADDNAKCHKRQMFFADPDASWSQAAPDDHDIFKGEKKLPVI
ncbi:MULTISPECIES: phospholipase D-like domain-containing protein [Mesorhizobium]|uniref:phospholipase D-like domain-containing protein n=2 Tax=Phyllobacteriaceae TaxID=69277 RepID=UPI000A410D0F|nr:MULTISPECIES: phospholipase D-like domain-containing protein [Mesorhizobium]MCA0002800.1 phospholipase D-like domain-containing protein [Mesorhizobium sp. B264B2A]MCA0009049.1 phospholipase D-like domain-containing protein [Mesorhizobium sp. B264B1B]MCA0014554.1 phospholipase D-like domain-containing protein [Mesorhizobium sp. B294B1A1]MCA0018189.1 phospholipase D-like domain-containing protein [Mesorhizobium sp. B264B1A]MCA0024665.1 phospholipase D-like domain-containing protein [Mesorhizo